MRYLPHTPGEIEAMLAHIGVDSIDSLFASIPEANRLDRALELEPALDEMNLMAHLSSLAAKNSSVCASFLGAGMYDHHIPPAVDQLLLRSEFYTAYTPYQAEVSQGTLQAIYEFQTTVCEIYGTEVANASMYDGASACAEAALMARRITKRGPIVVSRGVHPDYRGTLRTYLTSLAAGGDADLAEVPVTSDGLTDLDALRSTVTDGTAAVIIGYPNFFGAVEDVERVRDLAAARGALLIVANWEPYAFSVLKSPGELGADIVVGEGQALAVPPQFGGPGVGLFGCRKQHVRQIPGRLVGETLDQNGDRGFVLTLSTREQHIRRERATSNICTNHGLIALALAIRTAMLGKKGFVEVGERCLAACEYLKARLRSTQTVELVTGAPTFNEVTVDLKGRSAEEVIDRLAATGVLPGVALGRWYEDRSSQLLVAVTERHDRAMVDALVDSLAG